MAAAGGGGLGTGGKIRSRRYHLSSGRAPYTRNRQQNQQGIIGRVKDTVKSIVPVWLQKYFNNVEEGHEVSQRTNEPEEHVETQNDVGNDHFADKESLPLFARTATEPVRIQSDPASNQVMLNIPDVLTRPSLHRANLNINVLDSPALNCQPSTSGFSLVKEIKDSASLHDDDNISTTSGFSSRASDKDVAITRTGNAPSLWSPEADRTLNTSQNSSFNSKKPSFNPSAFASFLPNSSRLGDSPFYPGKTTYGGAAAVNQSRVRSTPYRVPVKKQVVAKPAHVTSGVTSLAARRILQSLEKMSSPLADAKRIPSVSSVSPLTAERSFSGESSSKRKKVDSSLPPVQKLVTPQSISVSSSLRKIRPSLASTLSNTSSFRTQTSDKHKEKGNHEPATPLQQTSLSYPTFSTPAANGFASGRGGGKMMRERGSTKPPEEEEVEVPCLPAVPLPISMTSLPKFSLNTEQKTSPLPVRQPVSSKSTSSTDASGFNFSQPVVKAISSNEEPASSPVGFTFRAPALKTSSPHENTKSMLINPDFSIKMKAPIVINNSSTKKAEEEQGICKPAQSLKEGSVLDILRSPGFQSTSSQQTRTTPTKSAVSSPKPLTFGQSSKQALGIWYCDCCLLENKASDNKCVACGTVKEQATEVTKPSITLATTTPSKNTSPLKCVQGFGDMFKAAPGAWDCDTCLVQNKSESSKCVACGSPKPGTVAKDPILVLPSTKPDMPVAPPDNGLASSPSLKFAELARKPIGSWECDVCCVQNKAEDNACVACTSPKPGGSTSLPATSFSTSLPASQGETQGFGKTSFSSEASFPPIKFGLPASETGEQKSSSSTDSSSNTNKVSFSFTFGQSSKTDEKKDKDKDFTFGTTTGTGNVASAPFKFGFSSPAPAEKDSGVKPLTTDFQFGAKPESSSNANLLGLSSKEKSDITPTFGLKKPEEKKTDTPVVGGFTFGKVDQKESASPFAFGKNEEKTESAPAVTSLFGSKSEAEQPKTFVFGKPEAGKADASKPSSFAFGAPNPTEKKEADQPAKPVFSFGASSTETGSSKPVFGFQGSGSSSAAPQSTNIGSTTSVFGSVPQTSSSNVFGGAVQANTGAPAGGSSAPSSTVFSSSTSLPAPTASSNVFGAALSSNTPSGTSNMFGSAPASGTPTSSSIVFGSGTSVNTTSSSNVFGNAAPTNTSASSNTLFGNSSTSTNPSSVPFVFGQPATTTAGSVFGSGNDSKSTFVFAGQESKPAETSSSTAPAAATPFVFGASTSTPTATGFSFGGTNASSSTGTSSNTFIFGASQPAPAPSGLAAASSVPTFGKTVAQTNAPAFGAPASGFPSAPQTVPSFGSISSNVPPPAFGQQSAPPNFGSSTAPAPSAGPSFQFGSSNFNFGSGSAPGVFTFGSNPSANPPQPANTGFAFNQTPSFNMGSNGKTLAQSSISNRKIKTARRRK